MAEQIDEKRKDYRTQNAPDDINMVKVESSNIHSVGYDGEEEVLYVKFRSGATYAYLGVPERKAMALLEAPSKGEYFADNIKDKYEFVKAPPLPKKRGIKSKPNGKRRQA